MKRINPKEVKALMDQGWTYVDVRSEMEFEQGHPEGALNLPLMNSSGGGMSPNPHFLSVAESVFTKEQKLVIGCQAGGRSLKAAQMLEAAGFTEVVDQRCGFGGTRSPSGGVEPGWAAERLPVSQGHPAGRSYQDLRAKSGR